MDETTPLLVLILHDTHFQIHILLLLMTGVVSPVLPFTATTTADAAKADAFLAGSCTVIMLNGKLKQCFNLSDSNLL
jgi:hypothetical protein